MDDAMLLDVKRGFTSIENDLELALHDLYGRLARMDLLTRPEVDPAPDTSEVTVALALPPTPVELPAWRSEPAPVPVQPYAVEIHADLPWWRRWLRRADRWFARQVEEAA